MQISIPHNLDWPTYTSSEQRRSSIKQTQTEAQITCMISTLMVLGSFTHALLLTYLSLSVTNTVSHLFSSLTQSVTAALSDNPKKQTATTITSLSDS